MRGGLFFHLIRLLRAQRRGVRVAEERRDLLEREVHRLGQVVVHPHAAAQAKARVHEEGAPRVQQLDEVEEGLRDEEVEDPVGEPGRPKGEEIVNFGAA